MSDDTISRQAVDKIINDLLKNDNLQASPSVWHGLQMIKQLPSAERRGRWEMKEDPYGFFDTIPVCSACGCTPKYRVTSAYCPNCGAKMEGEEE